MSWTVVIPHAERPRPPGVTAKPAAGLVHHRSDHGEVPDGVFTHTLFLFRRWFPPEVSGDAASGVLGGPGLPPRAMAD